MDYVRKLPFLLAATSAVIAGLVEYRQGNDFKGAYMKMLLCLLVFFILGLYIRSTIVKINEEIEQKKEKEEQERLALLEEEERARLAAENEGNIEKTKAGNNIDYRVDDLGENFSPLQISEIIRTKE